MNERGVVQIEFVAAVGLLLFPVFVFVMTIAPVVERRTVAGRAAAEAARAYVLADSAAEATAAAQAIIDLIDAGHPYELTLRTEGAFDRGETITVSVDVSMPVVIFPGIAELGVIPYTATHQERIEDYRSLP